MISPTQLDLQRAREITNLYGGNGLSTLASERLVAEKLAEWREPPSPEPLTSWDGNGVCIVDPKACQIRYDGKRDKPYRDVAWLKCHHWWVFSWNVVHYRDGGTGLVLFSPLRYLTFPWFSKLS